MHNNFKIVVPVYNARFYIEKCIDSIKNQKYINFKCIIVDDCSIDNTLSVIEKKIAGDDRFSIMTNEERQWTLKSTIDGTHAVCDNDEDIVIIVDGDDTFHDNNVLGYLNYIYSDLEIWATYGQYMFNSGEQGCCMYVDDLFSRFDHADWNISHLRTYKYFLFKLAKDEDFRDKEGQYLKVTGDMAVFWPIAEMAGIHFKFIPKILYNYNNKSILNQFVVRKEEQISNGNYLLTKPFYRTLDNKQDKDLDLKESIKIKDENFKHVEYISPDKPLHMEWYRGEEHRGITIYTDRCLTEIDNKDILSTNIAWLKEPPNVAPTIYEYIKENYQKFNYVFTYSKELLEKIPNAIFMVTVGTWLYKKDFKIYEKTKNISTIVSEKKDTPWHLLRHEVIAKFGDKFDLVCGRGYKPIEYKLEGLKDYRYLVFIQNTYMDYYFTDNLIDCFLTGVIPVFCGCPEIGKFFNEQGIITFKTIEEFEKILPTLTLKNYVNLKNVIQDNFNKALKYACVEDYLYLNFIRKLNTGSFLV